jgi:hypothetical protein
MAPSRHGLPVGHLARDCGVYLDEFTAKVDELLMRLSAAEASMPVPERRREICTAIWAAVQAAFEASTLSPLEREEILPLLQEVLIPYWQQHCAGEPQMSAWLERHSTRYLQGRNRKSQVATATVIVERLLDTMGTAAQLRPGLVHTLVPLFAHRMIGDTEYLGDIKRRIGIQLPLLIAVCTAADVVAAYEPALRHLRIG